MLSQGSATFSNEGISTNEIPHLSQLQFESIEKKYRTTNRLVSLISLLIVLIILTIVKYQQFFPLSQSFLLPFTYITWAFMSIGFLATLYNNFADKQKSFALREQDLSYRSGLIFRKTVTQPVLRIQHIELKRGPIDRKVGLAKLQVFSAGGALHTFEIPGLTVDKAESIRQFILDHKDVSKHD